MKKIACIIVTGIAAAAAALYLTSCAGLAGTTIGFTKDGVTITPPTTPIVIPVK